MYDNRKRKSIWKTKYKNILNEKSVYKVEDKKKKKIVNLLKIKKKLIKIKFKCSSHKKEETHTHTHKKPARKKEQCIFYEKREAEKLVSQTKNDSKKTIKKKTLKMIYF